MRIIFAGRDNSFNRKFMKELCREQELVSCLFLEGDRFTLRSKIKRIRKRIKKYGLLRAIDELAFQVFSRFMLNKGKDNVLKHTMPEYFYDEVSMDCPVFHVKNIHSEKWLEYIRKEKPDIIFSICCNVIFKPKLFNIPKYGTYILHEGITPEYKGMHTPLWALVNKEHEYLGYSLIKANKEIDGGAIMAQCPYELKDGEGVKTWSWVGHRALIEGLPDMRKALKHLEEEGDFTPVKTEGRKAGYYTWMTLSSFLKKAWR